MTIAQRTLLVVPCYNEAERLEPGAFLAAVRDEPNLGFVFVNDGSTDDTATVLATLCSQQPERLFALNLERNSGKAEAVRRGVLEAYERDAELSGYWDADLATPLRFIGEFARILERPDVEMVLGSRVRLLGRHVQRKAGRHYIGRGFATIAGLALTLPVYDTQCGAKLFRADDVFRQVFSQPFELGWCFDVEIFARLLVAQREGRIEITRQCVEFPLDEWIDAPGSKLTAKHFPRILKELGSLFVIAHKARRGP